MSSEQGKIISLLLDNSVFLSEIVLSKAIKDDPYDYYKATFRYDRAYWPLVIQFMNIFIIYGQIKCVDREL